MAEGMAFDQLKPPIHVTDPEGAKQGVQTEYPKHLHQAGTADDGGPRYIVVDDALAEAEAIAAGWCLARADALKAPADAPPPVAPARKR